MQSIQQVAKAHHVSDRTVRNWLASARKDGKELGTMRTGKLFFTSEEVEELASYGRQADAVEPEPLKAEIVPDDFFKSSELQATDYREARLPEGFDPSAMVKFFDGVAGQATDTSALVSVAQMAIQAVDNAMQTKVTEQRKALTQAEKDQAALDKLLAEAKVRLQVTALESKLLAERQTMATADTEAKFQELMGMGKPAAQAEQGGT